MSCFARRKSKKQAISSSNLNPKSPSLTHLNGLCFWRQVIHSSLHLSIAPTGHVKWWTCLSILWVLLALFPCCPCGPFWAEGSMLLVCPPLVQCSAGLVGWVFSSAGAERSDQRQQRRAYASDHMSTNKTFRTHWNILKFLFPVAIELSY